MWKARPGLQMLKCGRYVRYIETLLLILLKKEERQLAVSAKGNNFVMVKPQATDLVVLVNEEISR